MLLGAQRVAAYARFSSDSQREASIDDQLRNCRAYCERQGWPSPEVFVDAAISGARHDRPDYQRLLAAVHRLDVIVVDDLSRFGRDKEEVGRAVKRIKFAGVRLVGVCDGVDTSRKGYKVDVGLRGLMGELYLDDLADKTHRGLTGRALAGASAGGLPFGYRVSTVGERAIVEAEAAVVRRIFAEYVAGRSARQIAAGLNSDGVRTSRGGQWVASAIFPDLRRGIGILANPIYVGRPVWNRSRYEKHPETGRKVRRERPREEWIESAHPELAIVDEATWAAVQARQKKATGPKGGRGMAHLLSGLLKCGGCGGPIVIVDAHCYGCSRRKERGPEACSAPARFKKVPAEAALLEGVRTQMLSEAAWEVAQREIREALKRRAGDVGAYRRRLAEAEKVRENLIAAIKAGIISPTMRTELASSEGAVVEAAEALRAFQRSAPAQVLPRARELWDAQVALLGDFSRRKPEARSLLQQLIGEAIVKTENGAPVAEIAPFQITMVAGAGSERYLRSPIRIPLGDASRAL